MIEDLLEVYIMGILFQGEQQDHFFTGLFELFILSLCGLLHME